jgi:uncharacterized protein YcnI
MRAPFVAVRRSLALLAMIGGALVSPARAHVVLKDATAVSGTYHVATFRVPHGCGTSPTVAIRIAIPDGIVVAKPVPKPGWRIEILHEALPTPVAREGGILTQRPKEIAWIGGPLPDAYMDEFAVMLRLPAGTGPLWFPTVQLCEQGETRWIEVPPEGKTIRDMRFPPPGLTLVPAPLPGDRKD